MPDYVPIQDLTIVGSIGNNDLFPMSDGSGAYAVRGSTIKSYAATDAAAAAADAALSKTAAQNAAGAAAAAQSIAEGAASDAASALATANNLDSVVTRSIAAERTFATSDGKILLYKGSLDIETGANVTSNYRTRSGYVKISAQNIRVIVPYGYKAAVFYYTLSEGDYVYIGYNAFSDNADTVYSTGVKYDRVKLLFKRSDNGAVSDADISAIQDGLKLMLPVDESLSISGAAADAYETGKAVAKFGQAVNCSSANLFEAGGIAASSGKDAVGSFVPLRTAQGIPRDTISIKILDNAYHFRLLLYGTRFAMDYLGAWNGTDLVKSSTTAIWMKNVSDVQALYRKYPDCAYMRVIIVRDDETDCAATDYDKIEILAPDSPFLGKKYAALGDSITHGFIPRNATGYNTGIIEQSYAALASMTLGMGFANHGVDGSCVGDYSDLSSAVPMVERFDDLPDDADFISVMGGANDIRKDGFALGTMESRDTTSYYGALHTIFSGLYKKYFIDPETPNPHVKIFGIAPIKLLLASGGTEGGTGTLYDMEPLAQAMKEVANFYGFPCLDFLHTSGINPELNQTIHGTVTGYTGYYNPYITDGTHPTQEGQAGMGDILAGFLRTLM